MSNSHLCLTDNNVIVRPSLTEIIGPSPVLTAALATPPRGADVAPVMEVTATLSSALSVDVDQIEQDQGLARTSARFGQNAALPITTQLKEWRPITATFDRDTEFPRLFLPTSYRYETGATLPPHVTEQARERIEAALTSVFERLTLPIPDPSAPTGFRAVRYFPHMRYVLQEAGITDVKLYPSGGVVRSALGYLYFEMWQAFWAGRDPESALAQIANDTTDLPAHKIRGVGSDFDLLAVSNDQTASAKAVELALTVINAAEKTLGLYGSKQTHHRAVFAVGDVKDYAQHIARATKQGGSTLDFLSFDLETGKLVEPENLLGIVADFIAGHCSYVAPQSGGHVEQPFKQTVRGLRPFVEMPFLTSKNPELLVSELRQAVAELKQIKDKSSTDFAKGIEQFGKMVRNARFSAGHNRFYRAAPNSLESEMLKLIDAVSSLVGRPVVPEFVDNIPITANRQITLPPEIAVLLEKILLPVDDFIAKHTHNGTLYHGTKTVEASLYILRGGLVVSGGRNHQGGSACGSGGYSTPDRKVAANYAGTQGVVLPLQVKRSENLRILDWTQASTELTTWAAEVRRAGGDPFEILKRQGVIDIIINGYVLLQNMDAVIFPEDPAVLAVHVAVDAAEGRASDETIVQTYSWFARLAPFLAMSEDPATHSIDLASLHEKARHIVRHRPGLIDQYAADPRNADDLNLLADLIRSDRATNLGAASQLWNIIAKAYPDPHVQPEEVKKIRESLRQRMDNACQKMIYPRSLYTTWIENYPWEVGNTTDRKRLCELATNTNCSIEIRDTAIKTLLNFDRDTRETFLAPHGSPALIHELAARLFTESGVSDATERYEWLCQLCAERGDLRSPLNLLGDPEKYFQQGAQILGTYLDVFENQIFTADLKTGSEDYNKVRKLAEGFIKRLNLDLNKFDSFAPPVEELMRLSLKVMGYFFPEYLTDRKDGQQVDHNFNLGQYLGKCLEYYFAKPKLRSFKAYSWEAPTLTALRREIAELLAPQALGVRHLNWIALPDLNLDADRVIVKRWAELAPDNENVQDILATLAEKQPDLLVALLQDVGTPD